LKNHERAKSLKYFSTGNLISHGKLSFEKRSNIVNLLKESKASGKGGGGDSRQQNNENKNEKNKGTKSQKSGGAPNRKFKKNLSDNDRRLLDKLIGDDQVSQAEYMKRKIKNTSVGGGVRW